MFRIANGMGDEDDPRTERWKQMRHRSLSTGDHVQVDGKLSLYCDVVGWRESSEGDPWCMEDRIGAPFDRRAFLDMSKLGLDRELGIRNEPGERI